MLYVEDDFIIIPFQLFRVIAYMLLPSFASKPVNECFDGGNLASYTGMTFCHPGFSGISDVYHAWPLIFISILWVTSFPFLASCWFLVRNSLSGIWQVRRPQETILYRQMKCEWCYCQD